MLLFLQAQDSEPAPSEAAPTNPVSVSPKRTAQPVEKPKPTGESVTDSPSHSRAEPVHTYTAQGKCIHHFFVTALIY